MKQDRPTRRWSEWLARHAGWQFGSCWRASHRSPLRWHSTYPEGIESTSPGLRVARYPGGGVPERFNPERVVSREQDQDITPLGFGTVRNAHPGLPRLGRGNPGLKDGIPLG
jgi:hypothetical protein